MAKIPHAMAGYFQRTPRRRALVHAGQLHRFSPRLDGHGDATKSTLPSEPHFAMNVRLLRFEHRRKGRGAGATEASVSRWLTGTRYPNEQALIAIDRRYGVSPRELTTSPLALRAATP